MAEKTQPTPDTGSPRTLTEPPKKKGPPRFLAFLCCGASKSGDDDESLAAKPAKTKPERTPLPTAQKPEVSTAESSAADSKEPLNEKIGESSQVPPPVLLNEGTTEGVAENSTLTSLDRTPSGRNKPTPPLPGQAGTLNTGSAGPQIAVEAPTPISPISKDDEDLIHDQTSSQKKLDEDIEMTDSGPHIPITTDNVRQAEESETSAQPLHKDASQVKIDLPPPPPLDQRREQIHLPRAAESSATGQSEPQKWLLPALRPEHQGRKCLVLDLDETLVHSSFKVILSIQLLW
jgi:RNA polymerase II subunit A small phosphatase-like protein